MSEIEHGCPASVGHSIFTTVAPASKEFAINPSSAVRAMAEKSFPLAAARRGGVASVGRLFW
ncbi:MAG: hypothetical protein ABMA01_20385, partial [Chthoniobacteraceae bacterium]